MSTAVNVEISSNIFWVGVEDWKRRIFDALIPLPYGTSYNAYLVLGKDKTALIDTTNPGFEDALVEKITKLVKPEKIDYVVMNHAEPDHAGAIPRILSICTDAKLITTKKGTEMAGIFYDVPPERTISVKEGDVVELGGKTLRFIEAPWLHWPETMFTYCVEDRVLFPCDFFGAHLASEKLFDDEVGAVLLPEAKRYYAEIMMPFPIPIQRALDKVAKLDVKVIAPSHGPVYRNPKQIIESYEKWARGPLEPKAVIIYVSMWGSTEILKKTIAEAISSEGVKTVQYDLATADISHIARDLVDASAIVIGSPTVLGGIHPLVTFAVELIRLLKPRAKLALVFGSYGWAGAAANKIKDLLQPMGFEILETIEIWGPPKKADLEKAVNLGKLVAKRVKEAGA